MRPAAVRGGHAREGSICGDLQGLPCFASSVLLCSHSSHPLEFFLLMSGLVSISNDSSVTVPGGFRSQGCHGYLHVRLASRGAPPIPWHFPQAYLLAMNLINNMLCLPL